MKSLRILAQRALVAFRRFEHWFNLKWGWFFVNPAKLHRWERQAQEQQDQ